MRGRCFYCRKDLVEEPHVDHFVAWARYPRDLGHNLVLADSSCNLDKRDTLPAQAHLERWLARNAEQGPKLTNALGERFVCDLPTATQVARWSYECDLASGARLWDGRGAYAASGGGLLDVFG